MIAFHLCAPVRSPPRARDTHHPITLVTAPCPLEDINPTHLTAIVKAVLKTEEDRVGVAIGSGPTSLGAALGRLEAAGLRINKCRRHHIVKALARPALAPPGVTRRGVATLVLSLSPWHPLYDVHPTHLEVGSLPAPLPGLRLASVVSSPCSCDCSSILCARGSVVCCLWRLRYNRWLGWWEVCCVVWCGVVWCGVVLCGVVLCVWCGDVCVVWCCVVVCVCVCGCVCVCVCVRVCGLCGAGLGVL
jgi:hypothetical protein